MNHDLELLTWFSRWRRKHCPGPHRGQSASCPRAHCQSRHARRWPKVTKMSSNEFRIGPDDGRDHATAVSGGTHKFPINKEISSQWSLGHVYMNVELAQKYQQEVGYRELSHLITGGSHCKFLPHSLHMHLFILWIWTFFAHFWHIALSFFAFFCTF